MDWSTPGTYFCWAIPTILICCLLWLISISKKDKLNVKLALETLSDTVTADQQAINEALAEVKENDPQSTIWKNYRSSMIEVEAEDSVILQRTVPSSDYIKPESINPSLFSGYFLTWIPSVLTTIGVLGTFVGLQIGLSGIRMDGEVTDMLAGINTLIDGSKTAFNTSILGVTAGIIFGCSLRYLRQRKANSIRSLAHKLDELVIEVSPEEDLRELKDSNKLSEEHLKALIEKIGPTLQKSLSDMPKQIGAAIGEEIKNAVGAIGKQSSEDFGASLKSVYNEHLADLSGLAQAINEQAQVTQKIITKLSTLPGELERSSTKLESGANSLESVSERFGGWDEHLSEYSLQLKQSSTTLAQASGHLEVAATTLEGSVPNLEGAANNIQKTHQENQAQLDGGSEKLVESFGEISKVMQDFVTTGESLKDVSTNLDSASGKFVKLSESMQQGHENQKEASQNNKDAATKFEQASGHFDETAKHLEKLGEVSKNLNSAGEAASSGFSVLNKALSGLNHISGELDTISTAFKEVTAEGVGEHFFNATQALNEASKDLQHLNSAASSLYNASDKATETFSQASREHETFVNGLAGGVKALAEEIDHLLETYGSQINAHTQDRIREWNKASTDFGIQFTTKVDGLHAAIEDLDQTLKLR